MNIVDMISYLVRSIVDKPTMVKVTCSDRDEKKIIEVLVAPSDLPRVIGSQGRIFATLRSLVSTFGPREFNVECDLVVDVIAK
ncbi:MAG: hypothetical protein UU47_C0001G0104 [candidate division TM6 bacterium GW2011_GWE2_41_16]|nr:MAG: hypothetical protein UU47_C0001G0104 [candidate division TM6 bacterium GW2011_GWE2_41_16]